MKSRVFRKPRMALAVIVLCSQTAPVVLAQISTPTPASAEEAAPASARTPLSYQWTLNGAASAEAAAPAPTSETRPVQLSSGMAEILKLGRAHVGDEVMIAFIRNSGTTYHLSASEILYLRDQGVSDQVVTAMLTAGQNVASNAAQAAPQPAPTGPAVDLANSNPQYAPAATQPAPTYDAAAPVYAPPSAVYAYPAPSYGYYDSGPYYWGYPAFSLGFGFGGGYYGGYYGRGYYGYHGGGYYGGYHGGGYHGGGGHR